MTESINLNHLAEESSPYLLQHATNPVDWYPWGNEALEKAKTENKLLLISIGYAACHWCHVMEKETFENEALAELMNENYVCIKVDREERPDIDQYYMSAVQLINGNGGWPLNCFALPDGRPISGGTYFRPEQWEQHITSLARSYKIHPDKFKKAAVEISEGISNQELNFIKKVDDDFSKHDLIKAYENWKRYFDINYGGTSFAPKFPMPNNYMFLLKYYYYISDKSALDHTLLTLDNIANGGIYDQLGGGFARYSTDKKWLVPHFEKMLYDNGQMVSLYSKAYQLTKKTEYKKIINETLHFIKEEFTSPEGGFYSSYDADTNGIEGEYYVWKKNDIKILLGQNTELFCEYYNISDSGNWEGTNILHITQSDKDISAKYNISTDEFHKVIHQCKQTLTEERNNRKKPALDDKIITSWNAIMLKGYIDAYQALGNYMDIEWAIANAEFIERELLKKDNSLYHIYKNSTAKIDGFLDDYSFTAEAFIDLYQATFDEKWLYHAKDLINYAIEHFFDTKTGLFYFSKVNNNEPLSRKLEITDNVIPSSNSSMANALFKLGKIFQEDPYTEKAKLMLQQVKDNIEHNVSYFSNWALLMTDFIFPPSEVTIVGTDAFRKREELWQHYQPGIILAGSSHDSDMISIKDRYKKEETLIYCCSGNSCSLPVSKVEDLIKHIEQ